MFVFNTLLGMVQFASSSSQVLKIDLDLDRNILNKKPAVFL